MYGCVGRREGRCGTNSRAIKKKVCLIQYIAGKTCTSLIHSLQLKAKFFFSVHYHTFSLPHMVEKNKKQNMSLSKVANMDA